MMDYCQVFPSYSVTRVYIRAEQMAWHINHHQIRYLRRGRHLYCKRIMVCCHTDRTYIPIQCNIILSQRLRRRLQQTQEERKCHDRSQHLLHYRSSYRCLYSDSIDTEHIRPLIYWHGTRAEDFGHDNPLYMLFKRIDFGAYSTGKDLDPLYHQIYPRPVNGRHRLHRYKRE